MLRPAKPLITQYDLADKLGVGQKTVSRALAGEPKVAPALRARILAAAKLHGYRPNQSARSVRSRRFDSVLLLQLVEAHHHRLNPGLIDGIADGLAACQRSLVIDRLSLADLRAGVIPRSLREAMVDGILVHGGFDPTPALQTLLTGCGVPVVWINQPLARDAVHPDDQQGARLMTDHLLAAGHRAVAWYDLQFGQAPATTHHYSRAARIAGYRTAMADAGLPALLITPERKLAREENVAWIAAQLRQHRPRALACYGTHEALAAFYAAIALLGWRVPEDLALVLAHHESLSAGLNFTVARVPTAEVGQAAAEMLIARLDGGRPAAARALPFTLLAGETG